MNSTHRRWLEIVLALLIVCEPALAQAPRIDPAGIPGSLLICGSGKVSEAAYDRFIELAGGAKAKTAVLVVDDEKAGVVVSDGLAASAKKVDAAEPPMMAWERAKADMSKFTGVWIVTGRNNSFWQEAIKDHPLRDELAALLKRSGVIAVSGKNSNILTHQAIVPPDLIDLRSTRPSKEKKDLVLTGLVAFSVAPDAAMLINGRTLSAVGEGSTTISLALSKTLPGLIIALKGKTQADLTALRRSAYDRANSFPPQKVEPPIVENGTLVIVGGGGSPKDLYKKFVEYAGGAGKANIVIFPTANPDPLPKEYPKFIAAWEKAGAKKATVLRGRTQAEVESKEFLDTLKDATGLWFDGGRQWRFVDCYENTKALPLMFDVLKRGGVIGGTSAGATIQGDYLCRGGVFNNFDIRYEGYERGLGFLKGVAIDQHFTQRKRQDEMTSLMKVYPQYLGIGLDEATAIVVKGHTAEVIGKGKVHFYDANRKVEKGDPDYDALPEGGRYDLKSRKVISAN